MTIFYKKGFTLIEIALVMVLISILISITIPLISNVVARNDVGAAHESLYNAILRAQQLSKNQYQDSQWRVCLDNTNKQYTITSGTCSDPTNAEIIKISSNITISSEQTLDILFKAISGELDSTFNSITITLTGGGAIKSITINKVGIAYKDPITGNIAGSPSTAPPKFVATSCTYTDKKITIPYTAGEVGYNYASQTISSTGVTGLTATLLGDGPLATGGDTTTDITVGEDIYRVHTFTTVGTSSFNVINGGEFEYLVVGGGGAGGPTYHGAGGGAGGYRSSVIGEMSGGGSMAEPVLTLNSGSYQVTVGSGGIGGVNNGNGGNSTFSTIIAIGGGGGNGRTGGSGSGTNYGSSSVGLGTVNQGYNGGEGVMTSAPPNYGSGGGGGAGGVGGSGTATSGGNGGLGLTSSINGTPVTRAGGGGGSTYNGGNPGQGIAGGGNGSNGQGTSASANSGSGGGGSERSVGIIQGGAGGSGIVIVRYKLTGVGTLDSSGTLEYVVTGTPSGAGAANFNLIDIGGTGVSCDNSNIAVNVTETVLDSNYNNVSLLINGNGTNGSTSITDSSSNSNTVTAFGNSQISNVQSKFGGSSVYFDGSGDYLRIPVSDVMGFGSGDYTVEAWVYGNWPSYSTIFDNRTGGSQGVGFYTGQSNQITVANNSAVIITTGSIPANTWTHVAISRQSNVLRAFINGVKIGEVTDSRVYGTSAEAYIGTNGGLFQTFAGYMDDLRVTKGVARYNSNFTPTTTEFPTSGNILTY